MEHILFIVLCCVLGAVLLVLLTGVSTFVKGGEFNRKYGNLLMNIRVGTQFVAVVLLGIILLLHWYNHRSP